MPDEIGPVLDVTALVAYAKLGGLAAGELIMAVRENDQVVGIPATSLTAAWFLLDAGGRGHLRAMVERHAVLIPLDRTNVFDVAEVECGDIELAHAAHSAALYGHGLATYRAAVLKTLLPEEDIYDLSFGWA